MANFFFEARTIYEDHMANFFFEAKKKKKNHMVLIYIMYGTCQ